MTGLPALLRSPLELRHARLPNRLIRSATYEGMADAEGAPQPALAALYRALLDGGVGTIVTGFAFVSREGRAAQPRQCGMESDERVGQWASILRVAREGHPDARIIAQLAHTGRQTLARVTGRPVVGAGKRACSFFRQRVHALRTEDVAERVGQFGRAAARARQAGFDAVQLHAAHGYLIHQFLSPWTNDRRDEWSEPTRFLLAAVESVRREAGGDYPVWVKLSGAEDRRPGITPEACAATVGALDAAGIDAVEISYGTMEYAMNIFRGECPVEVAMRVNPALNRMPRGLRAVWLATAGRRYLAQLRPFEENYNVETAARLARGTSLAVIPVGGIRSAAGVARATIDRRLPAVSLCRPLVHDPAFAGRLLAGDPAPSGCTNCNLCAIHCDTDRPLRCYARRAGEAEPDS